MHSKRPSDKPSDVAKKPGDTMPPAKMLETIARSAVERTAFASREETIVNARFLATLGICAMVFEGSDGNRDARMLYANTVTETVFAMPGPAMAEIYGLARILENIDRAARILTELRTFGAAVNVPSVLRMEGVDASDWLVTARQYVDIDMGSKVLLLTMVDNAETVALAGTDPLTSLPNRRTFRETLVREHHAVGRHKEPLSLLYLDVDRFKRFNDEHGHDAGDAVLKAVACRLLETLRAEDLACRLGGEEFAVILPRADSDGAMLLAERVREVIGSCEVRFGDQLLAVTVSVGVATYKFGDRKSPDSFVRDADQAMLEAKESGRNCVRISNPGVAA